MDELSPLFQEIEFHEKFRGYDPEEVDAYVDRVAKAASLAQGRIAELQRRVEAAEERAREPQADSAGVSEAEETLRRTLVLAQRTADAAVAEAREEAAALIADAEAKAQTTTTMADSRAQAQLRDAEERAGRMLAEAETDRRALVEEAESAAIAAADEARTRLEGEVHDLARTRDFLRDDIEILERHLREQRARLVSSVATLSDLLEAPDALRVAPVPETSGVDVAAPTAASADETPPTLASADETPPTPASADEAPPAVDVPPADEATPADVAPSTADEGPGDDLSGHDAESAEAGAPTQPHQAIEVPDPHVLTPEPPVDPEPESDVESSPDTEADEPAEVDAVAEEPQWAEPVGGEPVIDLVAEEAAPAADPPVDGPQRFTTAADLADDDAPAPSAEVSTGSVPVLQETTLFDEASEPDPFLTQLRDAVAVDDDTPAALDTADDEAMSAFFDDEGDDDANRSWFGRRR